MKLREVPAALGLGLVAAIVAHALLFGDEHAMGGAYNSAVQAAACASVGLFVVGFAAMAWLGAGRAADGSILAARLAARLPGPLPVVVATVLSYAMAERLEAPHAAPAALLVLLALAACACLMLGLARAAVRAISRAVLAIAKAATFAPRLPMRQMPAFEPVLLPAAPLVRRRFARPPPRG